MQQSWKVPLKSKTFLFMRHAKSSWQNIGQDDKDRPLNKRGILAAKFMGAYIDSQGLQPSYVYCSTAARTRDTLSLMSSAGNWNSPEISYEDDLYLAPASIYFEAIGRSPEGSVSMVLGHNPGMEGVVEQIMQKELVKFPTAAIAVANCSSNGIEFRDLWIPRELMAKYSVFGWGLNLRSKPK